jgi:hypothetical protein
VRRREIHDMALPENAARRIGRVARKLKPRNNTLLAQLLGRTPVLTLTDAAGMPIAELTPDWLTEPIGMTGSTFE